MVRRVLFAGSIAVLGLAVQAEQAGRAEHAVGTEMESAQAGVRHAVTEETCTVSDWGYDEVRSKCRVQVGEAPKPNPALKGICTIYYGVRTCY